MIRYLWLFLCCCSTCFSQIPDSVKQVKGVYIEAPFLQGNLLRATGTVGIVNQATLGNYSAVSLVNSMNTVAGVRMEERSPGSYRLSIRGSVLRSPFGIRNVKVYADEFSLTDAGGNTYLNLIDLNSVSTIEILKGPASSIFGANTGGAILLNLSKLTKDNAGFETGSFGLLRQHINISQQHKSFGIQLSESFQRSDGYREQSGLNRKYFQLAPTWKYSKKGNLKGLFFFSDLNYETPGGLTQVQAALNPIAARPATAFVPGAVGQQAGIYNNSFFSGISNTYQLSPFWKHVVAFQYLHTDFRNPFITNYEIRKEETFGVRTYVSYERADIKTPIKLDVGFETGSTGTIVNNSANNAGNKGALIASDQLNANQFFGFSRLQLSLTPSLLVELSSSINFYGYRYATFYPAIIAEKRKILPAQWMPRASFSYQLIKGLALRASASRGYSPPTIAEIRASDNQINTTLLPEHGFNYETGLRYNDARWRVDATIFSFNLKDAIVRRVNSNDTEFFINAGGTKQTGLELQGDFWVLPARTTGFLSEVKVGGAYTYSNFSFRNYVLNQQNLNGNILTGIPRHVLSGNIAIGIRDIVHMFFQYSKTTAIWLNDINTVAASPYELGNAKIDWRIIKKPGYNIHIFSGVDNLFNEVYSLGNDLNAANGRYFNPAAGRNYYGGAKIEF